jgi:hypothetical protein
MIEQVLLGDECAALGNGAGGGASEWPDIRITAISGQRSRTTRANSKVGRVGAKKKKPPTKRGLPWWQNGLLSGVSHYGAPRRRSPSTGARGFPKRRPPGHWPSQWERVGATYGSTACLAGAKLGYEGAMPCRISSKNALHS